jgi:hemolysin III
MGAVDHVIGRRPTRRRVDCFDRWGADLFADRRNLHAILGADENVLASAGLGIGVWSSAVIGMALKLALPGRFDRLAIVLCLLLGWSGVTAYDSLASVLPSSSLWLLAIGGILYTLGTLFHLWQGLRFHNAIWHGFVLLAASCHYSAVLACLLWA